MYFTNDQLITKMSPLAASFFAGLLATPAITIGEGLMIRRQVHDISYFQSMQRSLRLSDLIATGLREVPFNIGVFSLTPMIKEKFLWIKNESMRHVVAATTTGLFVGMLTTPADKIKTMLQAEKNYISLKEISKNMYKRIFVREAIWRSIYTGASITIVSLIYDLLPKYFSNQQRIDFNDL